MALYAFDGTLNFRDRKGTIERVQSFRYGDDRAHRRETRETNVHRFREFYGKDRSEYLEGVGTRFGWLGVAIGGTFGAGGKRRLRKMYKLLCNRYFAGDHTIDVVGFSRGAALAVQFCHIIQLHGLRHPDNPRHFCWWYYRGLGLTFRFPKKGPHSRKPKIRFLGLWDMVASFGLPIGPFRNWSLRWFSTIPEVVEQSFHAMALDEVRATFDLVRAEAKGLRKSSVPGGEDYPKENYEVWFRGVHSNVGGGYVDRGLSDIALSWMMEMYVWSLNMLRLDGVSDPADESTLATFVETLRQTSPDPGPPPEWYDTSLETLEADPNGEVGRPADAIRQAWRPLPLRPRVHHSAFLRESNLVSDHYRSNRRLLRTLPHNACPVYDPPFFYSDTPLQAAEKLAYEAFSHIPIRPQDWLLAAGVPVFRAGTWWVAVGKDHGELNWAISRQLFVELVAAWILTDRPGEPSAFDLPQSHYLDYYGDSIEAAEMATRVLAVLTALERYVPKLWDRSA